MTVLKVLKVFVLIGFSILCVLFAVLLQANTTINSAALSAGYFNRIFDQNIKPQNIEKLVDGFTDNAETFMPLSDNDKKALEEGNISPELKNQIDSYKKLLKDAVDVQWLENEIPVLFKDSFAFFTSSANDLPDVDIKPLKNVLVNVYVNQMIAHSGLGAQAFEEIIKQIEQSSGGLLVNGKVNEKAVDAFMKMDQFAAMKMKRDTAVRILEKSSNRKSDGSDSKEQFEFAVTELVNDLLGTADMKDTLDLNLLLEKVYGSDVNPVTGARTMFNGVRTDVFLLNLAIVLLFLAIIAVIAFHPSNILKWTGTVLIISGALCLIPPVLAVIFNSVLGFQLTQWLGKATQLDLLFIRDWAISYINGVSMFMLVQSIIIIAVGAALLIGAHYVSKGRIETVKPGAGRAAPDTSGRHNRIVVGVVRAVAVLILVVSIPAVIYLFSRGITAQVGKFDTIIKTTDGQAGKMSVTQALGEVLGTKLFEGMGK